MTVTGLTSLRVIPVEVVIAWHTLVTDASHHLLLTLTQEASSDNPTATQGVAWNLLGTGRVTVTLFTVGVVVEARFTLVTHEALKRRSTFTLAVELVT